MDYIVGGKCVANGGRRWQVAGGKWQVARPSATVSSLFTILSSEEQARAAKFHFDEGLSCPLKSFAVTLRPDEPARDRRGRGFGE
ncbi:MAG TPA: hypothetical protein PLD25_31630 [Chloroflexota bacterium]|nr:hypothetical protein [Chloroflexota bacterium]